jgi:hypothetical protein
MRKKSKAGLTCSDGKGKSLGFLQTFFIDMKLMLLKYHIQLTVILLYSVLTVIFTYPVAFSNNFIPGLGDVYYYIWDFWWNNTALTHGLNPLYTTYVFYPFGASLVFSDATFFNVVLALPLQHFFGFVAAYNILWIFSFILSGFGMFILAKYLTRNNSAAFISGLIFMFCPFRFVHALGHLSLITTGWIPFYILFLIKTFKENDPKNPVIAGLFLMLIWYSNYYFFIFCIVFSVFYLVYYCLVGQIPINRSLIIRFGIINIVAGFFASPTLIPMITNLFIEKSKSAFVGGFESSSADLLSFFIPSTLHPYYGTILSIFPNLYENIYSFGIEGTVFAGFSVLLLSLIAVVKINTKDIRFWLLSTLFFALISLGPILHFNGISKFTLFNFTFSIPLPYYFLMKIPVFSLARAPGRWDVIVVISLAILAGFGLKYLFEKFNGFKISCIPLKSIFSVVISCLIIFEFLSIPYLVQSTTVPQFYHDLSQETGDFAILESPGLCCNFQMQEYQFYQTVHNKRIIGGYLGRIEIPNYPPFINNFIYLYSLGGGLSYTKDIISQNITEVGHQVLVDNNIRYVILHKNLMTNEQFKYADLLLRNAINTTPSQYENHTLIVYKIPQESDKPDVPYLVLGKNWYDVEGQFSENIIPYRALSNDGNFIIYSKNTSKQYMTFEVMPLFQQKNIIIIQNDNTIKNITTLSSEFSSYCIPITLINGTNNIIFHVREDCINVNSMDPTSKDDRCVNILVRNVSLKNII